MSAKIATSTTGGTAIEPEAAETLLRLTRQLETELLGVLECDSSRLAVDRLLTLPESLDALETALPEGSAEAAEPILQRLRLGLDRLACDLLQRGGWQHLDEARHHALLARHAAGLTQVNGIGPASAERLFLHGISDRERFMQLPPDALDGIDGLNAAVLARLKRELEAENHVREQ